MLAIEWVAPELWNRIDDWEDLVCGSVAASIFLTRDWLTAWWAHFGNGLDPCLLRVTGDDGRTLGIAPFYLERRRGPTRRLGMLGDRGVLGEYIGLAARRGSERQVARAVADWLGEQPTWDVADLNGLHERDPAARELELALTEGAARTHEQHHLCSAIALPRDFEEYLAGLSSKFRQTYRQRTNKLVRSCQVRFLRTQSEAELPGHLEALFRLHQARWARAGRPGTFIDPRTRSFYADVAQRLLRSGRLRFWHLEADGVIRASQFGFTHEGVIYSLQEAYDDEFRVPGIGGLGVILRGQVLRESIDEGLHAYDFLGGAEDHKLRWGASVHTVRRVRLARHGARAGAAWLATVGAGSARSWLKSAVPRPVLSAFDRARAGYRRRQGLWERA